ILEELRRTVAMKPTIFVCALFACTIMTTAGGLAQNQPAPAQPVRRPIPAPYQLAAEDQIAITVINFTNLSIPSLIVPPDGKIAVPLLEPIDVIGKTTDELARLLTEKWRKYVINPSVTVSLMAKRKENILF